MINPLALNFMWALFVFPYPENGYLTLKHIPLVFSDLGLHYILSNLFILNEFSIQLPGIPQTICF